MNGQMDRHGLKIGTRVYRPLLAAYQGSRKSAGKHPEVTSTKKVHRKNVHEEDLSIILFWALVFHLAKYFIKLPPSFNFLKWNWF